MASIRYRPSSDTWQVRYRHLGRQTSQTFATSKAAKQFVKLLDDLGTDRALTVQQTRESAGEVTDASLSLLDFGRQAIESRPGITDQTRHRYLRQLETVFPQLISLPVTTITRADVVSWLNWAAANGKWSGKTIANYRGLLSSVFADAMRAELVATNPSSNIRIFRTIQREMTFLSPQEFAHIHHHSPAFGHGLLTVLVATGLRFGEATALQLKDLDPAASTLTITRAWKDGGDLGAPKSRRSRRTIHIPNQVKTVLEAAAENVAVDDLLFTTPGRTEGGRDWLAVAGKPWTADKFHRRVWRRAVDTARSNHTCDYPKLIKSPRVHDLRHTCASWMLGAGVPIAAVSRHLGHESITTTVDRYGHLDPTIARQAADATGAALDSALGA